MGAPTRVLLVAVAVAALLVIVADALPVARWLGLDPPPVVTPALVARGREVLARRCWGCHREVPLAPRVRGWDVRRAYDAIGRLPELYRAMPPFPGTDEERRALAAYLAELGEAGAVAAP